MMRLDDDSRPPKRGAGGHGHGRAMGFAGATTADSRRRSATGWIGADSTLRRPRTAPARADRPAESTGRARCPTRAPSSTRAPLADARGGRGRGGEPRCDARRPLPPAEATRVLGSGGRVNGKVEVPAWVLAVTYVLCWSFAVALVVAQLTGHIEYRCSCWRSPSTCCSGRCSRSPPRKWCARYFPVEKLPGSSSSSPSSPSALSRS